MGMSCTNKVLSYKKYVQDGIDLGAVVFRPLLSRGELVSRQVD